jgi:hypothetical protein
LAPGPVPLVASNVVWLPIASVTDFAVSRMAIVSFCVVLTVKVPPEICAVSPAAGTPFGVQFAEVFQSPPLTLLNTNTVAMADPPRAPGARPCCAASVMESVPPRESARATVRSRRPTHCLARHKRLEIRRPRFAGTHISREQKGVQVQRRLCDIGSKHGT